MTKTELINVVAEKTGFSKKDSDKAVAAVIDAISETLAGGDKVQLVGRFQSRNYQKQLPDGTVLNKVAYEVSVSRLSAMKEDSFSEQLQSMSQRIPLQDTNMLNRAREY